MNQGITIGELRDKLQAEVDRKRDFKVQDGAMRMILPSTSEKPRLDVAGLGDFGVRPLAHRQIRERLDIPAKYYDRMMQDDPRLLCENVNAWLSRDDKVRLLRTIDDDVRAVLSDAYRPMDNLDFLAAMAKGLSRAEGDGVQIRSANVTEERMYVKVVTPALESDILPPGYEGGAIDPAAARAAGAEARGEHGGEHFFLKRPEPIRGGACFSNSEVGSGGVKVAGFVEVLRCTNAYTSDEPLFNKIHAGGQRKRNGDAWEEFVRDETRAMADRALWEEVADVVTGVFDRDNFDRVVRMFTAARHDVVTRPVVEVVDAVREKFMLTEGERDALLDNLIIGSDFTRFGVAQAATRHAGRTESYERATELETVGWQVLAMPAREWAGMAVAQ